MTFGKLRSKYDPSLLGAHQDAYFWRADQTPTNTLVAGYGSGSDGIGNGPDERQPIHQKTLLAMEEFD